MGRARSFDEGEVLQRTQQEFWNAGFAGTSLDDVMRATGLGKGSLYLAFGDKHSLFSRVFEQYTADVVELTRNALAGPDETALHRLEALLLEAAARTDGGTVPRACLLAKTTAELGAQDEKLAERARLTFEALENALTACIEQAERAGALSASGSARQHARLVLAVWRGIEAMAEAGVATSVLTDAATAAVASLPRR